LDAPERWKPGSLFRSQGGLLIRPAFPALTRCLFGGAAVSCLPEEEEKMRIRGFSVENVKELALTAWNVLIFIIWINHTLREQER
jgi:hypothetical protein